MIKKFNFTGRKDIENEKIKIAFKKDQNEKISGFEIYIDNLNELNLPQDAKVYVEVSNSSSELKQFEFGKLSSISFPIRHKLEEIEERDTLRFRILIVQPNDKKILASSNEIRIKVSEGREGILEKTFDDLENRLFKIEIRGDEEGPLLKINNKLPQNFVENNPFFIIPVAQSLLKEILQYMIFIEKDRLGEAEWHEKWIKFIESFYPQITNEINDLENLKETEKLKLIETIVDEFCNKILEKKWGEFTKKIEGG